MVFITFEWDHFLSLRRSKVDYFLNFGKLLLHQKSHNYQIKKSYGFVSLPHTTFIWQKIDYIFENNRKKHFL